MIKPEDDVLLKNVPVKFPWAVPKNKWVQAWNDVLHITNLPIPKSKELKYVCQVRDMIAHL